jgi:hypothetical protein
VVDEAASDGEEEVWRDGDAGGRTHARREGQRRHLGHVEAGRRIKGWGPTSTPLFRRQRRRGGGRAHSSAARGSEMKLSVAMKKFGSVRWISHVRSQINSEKRCDERSDLRLRRSKLNQIKISDTRLGRRAIQIQG